MFMLMNLKDQPLSLDNVKLSLDFSIYSILSVRNVAWSGRLKVHLVNDLRCTSYTIWLEFLEMSERFIGYR